METQCLVLYTHRITSTKATAHSRYIQSHVDANVFLDGLFVDDRTSGLARCDYWLWLILAGSTEWQGTNSNEL